MANYTFTNAGEGRAYYAPHGTALPETLTVANLATAMTATSTVWKPLGTFDPDGLTINFAETTASKDWNGKPVRAIKSGDGTAAAKSMEVLNPNDVEMVFGEDNISGEAVNIDRKVNADPVCFCAICKDGDKAIAFASTDFLVDTVNAFTLKDGEQSLLDWQATHSGSYLVMQQGA